VFYEVTDTYSHVLRRVLMYGKTGGEGPDIPDGWIWSLVRDPQNDLDCWHSPIGAQTVEVNVQEACTR
jgi:hypothetical protein